MSQSNRIIRLCNRCIRRDREKFDPQIHEECLKIRLTQWECPYYYCKIQDKFRIGRHTFPIDILDYEEKKANGHIIIVGRSLWQRNTPKEGKPALLPLRLLDYHPKDQSFGEIDSIITDRETGHFQFDLIRNHGEFYLSFCLDDVNIFICRKAGMVTGHECQECFQQNVKVKKTFSHQIRCRRANIVKEYSFEFLQNKRVYVNINPILNG